MKRLLQSILVNDELYESVLTETGAESETEGKHETDSESLYCDLINLYCLYNSSCIDYKQPKVSTKVYTTHY